MKLRNLFFVSSLFLSKESAAFIVVHDRSEHVMEKNSKCHVRSFTVDGGSGNGNAPVKNTRTVLHMAQISQKDAQSGIDKVVKALQNDRRACDELGKLVKVTNVLGFGSPKPGTVAVRFNAQFKRGGMGRQAIPMPFGLGQTNKSEGRGVMVGQVKASVNQSTGKVLNCSVFRDLGYGRSFDLKCQ